MGGKSNETTTTQRNDPWAPAQPYLQNILGQANQLYNRGSQYYPFSTVTPFSNQTESALTGIENMAGQPNQIGADSSNALRGILNGSNPALSATANGDYLNNNPHLHEMFGALSGDVTDAVNGQFSLAGRTGSPAHAGEMTKELGNLGAMIYGQDYARERQNQLSAAGQLQSGQLAGLGLAPSVTDQQYDPLNRLAGVGAARENQGRQTLQDLMSRWDFSQNAPWQNLGRFASLVNPIAGQYGTSTSTQPNGGPSDWQQGIGAAISLASLFASDRDAKTDIEPVSDDDALAAINAIPSFTYRYIDGTGDNGAEPRIGPMAQDWAAQFGGDPTVIPMPQMIGAMLSAIKALSAKVDALEAKYGAR